MSNFTKAFILSLIIFFIHSILLSILTFVYYDGFGYYGFWGGVIYFFVFGFWAYYLCIFIYLYISGKLESRWQKYGVALVLCIIGYIGYRGGDIIDNDFIHHFKLIPLALFIFTSVIIVLLDQKIGKTKVGDY